LDFSGGTPGLWWLFLVAYMLVLAIGRIPVHEKWRRWHFAVLSFAALFSIGLLLHRTRGAVRRLPPAGLRVGNAIRLAVIPIAVLTFDRAYSVLRARRHLVTIIVTFLMVGAIWSLLSLKPLWKHWLSTGEALFRYPYGEELRVMIWVFLLTVVSDIALCIRWKSDEGMGKTSKRSFSEHRQERETPPGDQGGP